MAVYACGCLNVKIHAKEVRHIHNSSGDGTLPFLGPKLAEITLDDLGIVIEQSYLVHRHTEQGWVQYQCVNCSWRTHAVRATLAATTVLVNTRLESDPTTLTRLGHSANFSPAFNIVLQDDGGLDPVTIPDTAAYEAIDAGISRVGEQVNNYLQQERANMEERIRTFEHEQRSMFSQLQTRCQKEKSHMISLLVKAVTAEENQLDRGDNSIPTDELRSPEHLSKQKSSPEKMRTYSEYDQNPDSDALFYLDELEPQLEETFYDESHDDHMPITSKYDRKRIRTAGEDGDHNNLNLFSTSVPISVPMWPGRRSSSTEEDDEEEATPADPSQMAANMQALAESITDTGRYIFGERPRPRLNTGDGMVRYMERPRQRLNTADSVVRRK